MKNTKIMLRALTMLLAVLMIVSVTACKDDGNTDDTGVGTVDTIPEGDEKLELPDVNYGGSELFTILCRSGSNSEYINDIEIKELTTTTDSVDKAVYTRNRNVETQFGVKISLISDNDTAINSAIINTVGSGDDAYDLVANQGRYVFQHIVADRTSDINDFEYIDLDKSWWNQSAKENWATPGGKIFAMNGDISYLSIGSTAGIYFNKTILNDAKITLPYTYVREGTWTFEKYKQMIIQASGAISGDGSGILGQDMFAYATEKYRGPGAIIDSTGVPILERQSDGKYKIGVQTQRVYDAADAYTELLNSPYSHLGALNDVRSAFAKGTVVFTEDNIKVAPTFSATVDFGIVPIYKYDDVTEDYPSYIGSGTNTFFILKTVPVGDREFVGVITEALAYYGQKLITPVYYDRVLSYQAINSPDDLEMLNIIHDSMQVSFAEYCNPGNICGTLQTAFESNTNYSTVIAGLGKAILLNLESWYALDNK
ncbi:MAG: hypothetical protein IJY08_03635 [Clostridia bacterium]|nr:hypothetical protein [Clostridia bacterium]